MWKFVIRAVAMIGMAAPLQAQEPSKCDGSLPQTSIPLSGSEMFLLRPPPADGTVEPSYLYLQLDPMTLPTTICVARVALDGKDRPELRNSVTLTPAPIPGAAGGQPRIAITVKDSDFRAQGQWRVTGVVDLPKPAARSQFSFTLVRKPAALQVPANLKLRISDGEVSPASFPVRETGAETGIDVLSVTLDPVVNPDRSSTALLTFDSVALKPGDMVNLSPKASGVFPLGSTSSKLTFAAPELAAPLVLNVEIICRLPVCWLLVALALGLLSSIVFRHLLAARQILDGARLEAANEMARVVGLAEEEPDPVVRQALAAVARALESAYIFERSKQAIDKAVADRKAEADRIVNDATSRRAKLRQDWEGLRKTYDPAVPLDPALGELTAALRGRLAEIGRTVQQGWLFEPERQVQEATDTLVPQLQSELATWSAALKSELDGLVRWKVPGDLSTEAGQLSAAAGAPPAATPAAAVAAANKVALDVRSWVDQRADRQRAQEMLSLVPDLRTAQLVALANSWTQDAMQLLARPPHPSVFTDLAGAVRHVGQHRTALLDILSTSSTPRVVAALAAYDLPGALTAQAAAPTPPPPVVPTTTRLFVGQFAGTAPRSLPVYVPPITLPARADYIITSPQVIPVGTEVSLQLVAVRPLAAGDDVQWTGPTAVGADRVTAKLTAAAPGFVDVSCTVLNAAGAVLGSARTVLLVAGGGVARAKLGLLDRVGWQDGLGIAFSALIALGSGYLMLEGTWAGRPDQWVTAFLWGSVVDLGLAKAGEIAKPVAQRVTLPPTR